MPGPIRPYGFNSNPGKNNVQLAPMFLKVVNLLKTLNRIILRSDLIIRSCFATYPRDTPFPILLHPLEFSLTIRKQDYSNYKIIHSRQHKRSKSKLQRSLSYGLQFSIPHNFIFDQHSANFYPYFHPTLPKLIQEFLVPLLAFHVLALPNKLGRSSCISYCPTASRLTEHTERKRLGREPAVKQNSSAKQ